MIFDDDERALYPLIDLIEPDQFPLIALIAPEFRTHVFDALYYTNAEVHVTESNTIMHIDLAFQIELALRPLSNDLIVIVLGSASEGWTDLEIEITVSPEPQARLIDFPVSVRVTDQLLKPMLSLTERDVAHTYTQIELGTASLSVDTEGLSFDVNATAQLPLCMIANTGLLIEAETIQWLSATDMDLFDLPEAFDGIYVNGVHFHLPNVDLLPDTVRFNECYLNDNGISCKVTQQLNLVHDGLEISEGDLVIQLVDSHWQAGIDEIEVDIEENIPHLFRIAGVISIPLLPSLYKVEFGLEVAGENTPYRQSISIESLADTNLDLEINSVSYGKLSFSKMNFSGELRSDGFSIDGSINELSINLDLIKIEAGLAEITVSHSANQDEFRIKLEDVPFGPLDEVDAELVLRREKVGESDNWNKYFSVETEISWSDLRERISLPDNFPEPPENGRVTAALHWEQLTDAISGIASTGLVLILSVDFDNPDRIWEFIPFPHKPDVRKFQLQLEVRYNDADEFKNANTTNSLAGELSARIEFRLPELPDTQITRAFKIHAGDDEGWVIALIKLSSTPALELSIENPLTLDINVPGLMQDEPPVHIEINKISFDISQTTTTQGNLFLKGEFGLRPIKLPQQYSFAPNLDDLLGPLVEHAYLRGVAELELKFKDSRVEFGLDCEFPDAHIEIDVLRMIESFTRNFPPPVDVQQPANSIPLDVEIEFAIKGVKLKFGSIETGLATTNAAFGITVETRIGSLPPIESSFAISDRELSFGIDKFDIPLRLPRFQVGPEDLIDPLTHADLISDAQWQTRLNQIAGMIDVLRTQITELEMLREDLRSSTAPALSPPLDRIISEIRSKKKQWAEFESKYFILQQVAVVRSKLHENIDISGQNYEPKKIYGLWIKMLVETLAFTRSDSCGIPYYSEQGELLYNPNLKLRFKDIKFTYNYSNPRDVRVGGSVCFADFAADDPLKVLENVSLSLGLSADLIYFSLDYPGREIPVPKFGRYEGGSVTLEGAMIGFGYTKRSFAVAFSGGVVLPPQFLEDLDTTQRLGVGVRLPHRTKLYFRFDLIPVPYIKVLPYFEFSLDMRDNLSPGIADSHTCEPYWDGLQFHMPNIYEFSVKRFAFSPMFGPFIAPNSNYSEDIVIGDEMNGTSLVIDNFLNIGGIYNFSSVIMQIPFFACFATPFVDNYCFHARLAGFGINFDIQRPFPSFSLTAMLEGVGLLCDPMMPVDPNGDLANSMRITLKDAYINLPVKVLRWFPQAQRYIDCPVEYTINLATFLPVLQKFASEIKPVIDQLAATDLENVVDNLTAPDIKSLINEALAELPKPLRSVQLNASFAGFDAEAELMLIDPMVAVEKFRGERAAAISVTKFTPMMPGDQLTTDKLKNLRPNLPQLPGSAKIHYPENDESKLFSDLPFEPDDLKAVKAKSGVVVSARAGLFNGQYYNFIGFIYEDASFEMVTVLGVDPLQLTVMHIPVKLPLQIQQRLTLSGNAENAVYAGSIKAEVKAIWDAIPDILRFEIGKQKPASVELFSNGKFSTAGQVIISIFNGACQIKGSVEVTEYSCLFDGDFEYSINSIVAMPRGNPGILGGVSLPKLPVIDLKLNAHGALSQRDDMLINGKGTLNIFDIALPVVEALITNHKAEIKTSFKLDSWKLGGKKIKCDLEMQLSGGIDLKNKTWADFNLSGHGSLDVFGLSISGICGIISRKPSPRDSEPLNITVWSEGTLSWAGADWFNARLEIGNKLISMQGQTTFMINPTLPSFMSAISSGYLRTTMSGKLSWDESGKLVNYSLHGDAALALRLPGMAQEIPIALFNFNFDKNRDNNRVRILSVRGFAPSVPHNIPIPTLTVTPVRNASADVQFRVPTNLDYHAGSSGDLVHGVPPTAPSVTIGGYSNPYTILAPYTGATIFWENNSQITIDGISIPHFDVYLVWRESERKFDIEFKQI